MQRSGALPAELPTGSRPNKRLKLTGGDRFKGNGVLCAGAQDRSTQVSRASP